MTTEGPALQPDSYSGKSGRQGGSWKQAASESPDWLETSFTLLVGTFRRLMIGDGPGWGRGGSRSRKWSEVQPDRCPASGRPNIHEARIHSTKPVSQRFGDDKAWPCFIGARVQILSSRKTGIPCQNWDLKEGPVDCGQDRASSQSAELLT